MKMIFAAVFMVISLYSESVNTNLTDPSDREKFRIVTSRIRCICLPSLPIKSCSFNNCEVSALLKNFIENRIRQGESAEEIIRKMQTGFGEEALKDDIVQKFLSLGSEGMARSIVNGFGEKILAEPEPIWINLSIGAAALAGISIIILYFRKNRKNDAGRKMSASESDDLDRILNELKQEK